MVRRKKEGDLAVMTWEFDTKHLYTFSFTMSLFNSLYTGTAGFMAASLPSEEESDVKCGAVQIYKLEQEHLQSKAVLPLRLCPWVL